MVHTRVPAALRRGDLVALLSPASWSEQEGISAAVETLESWGLRVRLGQHARDRLGYLAGADVDRLEDLNAAIRDPDVRAVVALRGGCGSSRLSRSVDVLALGADPKPIVGFSDITALHCVWHAAGVVSLHGCVTNAHAESVRRQLCGQAAETVRSDPDAFGASLSTSGRVGGKLFGGNLEMLARSVGVVDMDLRGHVLLLEINRSAGLGMVDRALTQLILSGTLDGVRGVALGALQGFEGYRDRGWDVLDVLRERLSVLGVPVLAGLPLGHLPEPVTVPLGVDCRLDADAGTFSCSAGLRVT